MAWWYSGASSGKEDIQNRYPAFIGFFVSALLWRKNRQIRSTSQSHTSRCNTRVKESRSHVPSSCIVGSAFGTKFYQYTALDEYSRFRYVEAFEEASTYSSTLFLRNMFKAFKFKVECVQTDNGPEFTNRFSRKNTPTLFETELKKLGIEHRLIRPLTPRHNGKVERSHRKVNERFYAVHKFHSFEDFKKQFYIHNWNTITSPCVLLAGFHPSRRYRIFFIKV